ncbi:MAG: Zn-ribbon domain-containing OB-fold protein [Salinirussus sp.]
MSEVEAVDVEQYESDGRLDHAGWTRALEDGILLGQQCVDCSRATAAPKAACPHCGSEALETRKLSDRGEIYTETTVAVPPAAFEGPYQVAIVSLETGTGADARVMGMIDGEADIGEVVEFAGTVQDDEEPGPLFEPV